MSRRIEIELTSDRGDGSWTWRAAGARQPRGVLAGRPAPRRRQGRRRPAGRGRDRHRRHDGHLGRRRAGQERTEPERIEIVGSPRRDDAARHATLTLGGRRVTAATARDRGDRGDRTRPSGASRDAPGRSGRGRPTASGADCAGRATAACRPARRATQSDPRRSPSAAPTAGSPRGAAEAEAEAAAAGARAPQGRARRAAARAAADRRAGAEGRHPRRAPGHRRREREAGRRRRAADQRRRAARRRRAAPAPPAHRRLARPGRGRPGRRRRARPARPALGRRRLRRRGRDDETRALAAQLRETLDERVEAEQAAWLEDLDGSPSTRGGSCGRCGCRSRPPKAGTILPAELRRALAEAAGEALTADVGADRWAAVLDATAYAAGAQRGEAGVGARDARATSCSPRCGSTPAGCRRSPPRSASRSRPRRRPADAPSQPKPARRRAGAGPAAARSRSAEIGDSRALERPTPRPTVAGAAADARASSSPRARDRQPPAAAAPRRPCAVSPTNEHLDPAATRERVERRGRGCLAPSEAASANSATLGLPARAGAELGGDPPSRDACSSTSRPPVEPASTSSVDAGEAAAPPSRRRSAAR